MRLFALRSAARPRASVPWHAAPARVLAITFLSLIAAGTVLLRLPVAAYGDPLSLVDALFTATSAVCVTGLIVVDTPHDLSLFGQAVVLALIQLGGLGYMVITTVVAVAIGRQLTIQERLTLQEALNVDSMEGLARFGLTVLKVTLAFELAGALLLAIRFAGDVGLARGTYLAVFHAVSAFNNAGFSLFSDSLMGYRSDWFVNGVVMALVISGGLGFVVLTELGRRRRGDRLSIHTRLVLSVTAILIVTATVAFFLMERQNPLTLAGLPLGDALLASLFQAVTPRTAGFNTLHTGALMPGSLFLLMLLMFVGAAPGGTAGGIKITTFSVTLAVLWAMVRGAAEPTLLRRRIAPALIARVLAISLVGFLALNLTAGVLLLVEGRDLLPTLFEATSAFGTVGLSMGEGDAPVSLAGHFSNAGKLLIVVMMFSGRLGPLTLAVAIARGARPARVRYPVGRILVG